MNRSRAIETLRVTLERGVSAHFNDADLTEARQLLDEMSREPSPEVAAARDQVRVAYVASGNLCAESVLAYAKHLKDEGFPQWLLEGAVIAFAGTVVQLIRKPIGGRA